MTYQEITDLIKVLNRSKIAELKLKEGDFELSIRTQSYVESKGQKVVSTVPVAAPQVVAPAAAVPATPPPAAKTEEKPAEAPAKPASEKKDTSNYLEIKSPMVGTFYRSASPEKPAYVEIGKKVNVGDTVCIIEAMKLFNEIESEVSGTIVKVMVDNEKPVEYDQVLFLVEPD
jgi:acetyl-CoA carboxylase biotin carboxyl carrier protein